MEEVSVSGAAEQAYFDGMEYLAGGGLLEAEQEFLKVIKMPSYLDLTALARLRLGDALFHQGKYDEAIDTYGAYAQRHDGSANVPYALFMMAKAHFELAPSDIWFMPPVYELDLSSVQQARVHLERFIRQFPRSRFVTEALQLRDRCIDVQWAHNQYVVDFYRDRKQWIGVVFRLHQAMQQFPTRSHKPETYATLGDAYRKLGWRARSIEVWEALASRWPTSPEGRRASGEIRSLQADIAAAKARGDATAEAPVELPPSATFKPEQTADRELDQG